MSGFKIKTWVPIDVEPEADDIYDTIEAAQDEIDHLSGMQPENCFSIVDAETGKPAVDRKHLEKNVLKTLIDNRGGSSTKVIHPFSGSLGDLAYKIVDSILLPR